MGGQTPGVGQILLIWRSTKGWSDPSVNTIIVVGFDIIFNVIKMTKNNLPIDRVLLNKYLEMTNYNIII